MMDQRFQDRWKNLLPRVLKVLRSLFLIFCLLLFLFFAAVYLSLPAVGTLHGPDFPGSVRFLDREGKDLAGFGERAGRRQVWTPIHAMPSGLVDLVIALEDFKFWRHHGVDYREMYYALQANLALGEFRYGASTITQQLVKNVYLSREKSLLRKLREVMLALQVESRLGKQQILEWYLNIVEMAPAVYGLAAGSRYYFGKALADLDFPQQVFLAAVIPAPKRYARRPAAVLKRIRSVSRRLLRFGRINRSQAAAMERAFSSKTSNALLAGLRTTEESELLVRTVLQDGNQWNVSHGQVVQVRLSLDQGWQRKLEKELVSRRLWQRKGAFYLVAVDKNDRVLALGRCREVPPGERRAVQRSLGGPDLRQLAVSEHELPRLLRAHSVSHPVRFSHRSLFYGNDSRRVVRRLPRKL